MNSQLKCIKCEKSFDINTLIYQCECGGLIEVNHPREIFESFSDPTIFDKRAHSFTPIDRSGVWRFRELILPGAEKDIVTHPKKTHPQQIAVNMSNELAERIHQ